MKALLIALPFIDRPYPRALPGGAGWVENATLDDFCHYRRMQEHNLSNVYHSKCDQMGMECHGAWDIDARCNSQNDLNLNLSDFDHMPESTSVATPCCPPSSSKIWWTWRKSCVWWVRERKTCVWKNRWNTPASPSPPTFSVSANVL